MGGSGQSDMQLRAEWKKVSQRLQRKHKSVLIPISGLTCGLSRHRALLFKALADFCQIPCRLLRGEFYTGTQSSYYLQGSLCFVQLCKCPQAVSMYEVSHVVRFASVMSSWQPKYRMRLSQSQNVNDCAWQLPLKLHWMLHACQFSIRSCGTILMRHALGVRQS